MYKVGDIVKIKDYDIKDVPSTLWVEDMYGMIGHEVEVSDVDCIDTIGVNFDGHTWYVYTDDVEPIEKGFTKNDLETDMIVEYRSGGRALFVKEVDAFLGEDDWMSLRHYDDDLTTSYCDEENDLDIVKVYKINDVSSLRSLLRYSDTDLTLIWKREKPKKMTLEEIENKLGYKIELVGGEQ